MKALILTGILIFLAFPAIAQNDGTPSRIWSRAFNLQHDTTIGTDSADLFLIPSKCIIERVIWCVDTALSGTDSLQLRAGETERVICSYRSADGGDGTDYRDIQICQTAWPFIKYEHLRLILYVAEGRVGQVRLIIIYRELN